MADPADDKRREELTAYLDGELDERAAAQMEERLSRDSKLRREADALKRTWDLLDFLPQPEPSGTFTSRTLDKLAVLKPSLPTKVDSAPVTLVEPASPPAKRRWLSPLALTAAALLTFLIGYALPGPLLKKGPRPLAPEEAEQQMARDLRVLEHLQLYQLADDLDFVLGLDNPDLFGD